ncbi:TKL protein kinase [Plasmodium falciparum RAJ116]|uniref:TKL protein kinase n=1 Tax=Plasmodium falciparum RAJ116 TaxID=580058 RepID=A0A0L0CXL9_PLAFA|nr:TKL protein kinase [Plasmodium falciparum RAJ116]
MGKRIKCNNVSYIRTVRGVYIGRIENGQKNGWGLQINNNGNKYEGLFKNDEKYLFGLELICCLCGHTYRNKVQNEIYEKGKIHYKDVNNISAYNNDDQHDNIHHEKVYHENIHHEKVYHDNINHEKVYHGNIYDHNIYHNNKFNFQYSSENEFAKGNICVHENRYIYIGTYKKGKKHGKGILINYNNYFMYSCIFYKTKLYTLREKYKYTKKSNSKLTEKINEDFILKKEQLHILNLIGRGGINNTALKIFLNKKKNILEYFTELYIVSNLRHPNVTLFLGAINNPRAIVLEYIQYGTLFDILHKYKINMKLQDIIKISKDITAFMSFLHNKGIMHCDLKSSNILISITRDIKICDFGLSVFNKYNKPKYLGIVGTYQWTAPEVLRSEGYTKEADIYSFGVILWEMIHRKIPFSDMKNPLDIIAHVGYANKKLSVTNKNIPDQLKYILHSCLHKNTHKRKSFLFWSEYFDFLYNVTDIPKEDHTSFFF